MCFVLTALTYSIECITCFDLRIDSVDKQHYTLFNALDALIFVLTVSTNNIAYTIQCIGCFDLVLTVSTNNIQSNYNVDSNTKTLN